MNIHTACGIVLRVAAYGESDKLVTLYGRDTGRVTGIAKGAYKSRHRFVNKLEPFSLLRFMYRPPRQASGLLLLTEADLLAAHLPLRTNWQRYTAASYLCELLWRFTREHDPDPGMYTVFHWALAALQRGSVLQKTVVLAHLRLLEAAGYRPDLHRCVGCRQPVMPGPAYLFLPGSGALLCRACSPVRRAAPSLLLSVQTIRLLGLTQTLGLDRLHRIRFPPASLVEAHTALHHFTVHLVQQDFHAWDIFRLLPGDRGPGHRGPHGTPPTSHPI